MTFTIDWWARPQHATKRPNLPSPVRPQQFPDFFGPREMPDIVTRPDIVSHAGMMQANWR